MTTYIYETVPSQPGARPVRFEVRQSMKDAPLTHHPETGEPVRRIVAGGYGIVTRHSAPPATPCSSSCACVGPN
jgi:predicted nucleic acid-binding Zn ribbon protein